MFFCEMTKKRRLDLPFRDGKRMNLTPNHDLGIPDLAILAY